MFSHSDDTWAIFINLHEAWKIFMEAVSCCVVNVLCSSSVMPQWTECGSGFRWSIGHCQECWSTPRQWISLNTRLDTWTPTQNTRSACFSPGPWTVEQEDLDHLLGPGQSVQVSQVTWWWWWCLFLWLQPCCAEPHSSQHVRVARYCLQHRLGYTHMYTHTWTHTFTLKHAHKHTHLNTHSRIYTDARIYTQV